MRLSIFVPAPHKLNTLNRSLLNCTLSDPLSNNEFAEYFVCSFSCPLNQLKKSTTLDNGNEFYFHKYFEIPVYFCLSIL